MGKLVGAKTVVSQGRLRRGTLHAERNAAGRIVTVSLTCEGIGYISFAHIQPGLPEVNAAERLEALRGLACPLSAVRVRRNERAGYGGHAPEYVASDGLDN